VLIQKNREPKPIDLRLFGLVCGGVFGLLGWLVWARSGSAITAGTIWTLGAGWVVVYYGISVLQRPMYKAWMTLFYPLGWLISHAMLAIVYFLIIAPLGLLMRLLGRDPLDHSLNRGATSYWLRESYDSDSRRYFKQF